MRVRWILLVVFVVLAPAWGQHDSAIGSLSYAQIVKATDKVAQVRECRSKHWPVTDKCAYAALGMVQGIEE